MTKQLQEALDTLKVADKIPHKVIVSTKMLSKCSLCGGLNGKDVSFCGHCGAKFNHGQPYKNVEIEEREVGEDE